MVKQENIQTGLSVLGVTGDYGVSDLNYATATASSSSLVPTGPLAIAKGYSLEDIWQLITSNTKTEPNLNTFPNISSPEETMHTISDIYDELVTLKSSLTPNKIRSGITYLGNTGFCDVNDDGSCVAGELNNVCGTGNTCNAGLYCGDDSYACVVTCSNVCTTGAVGSSCMNNNQCATGYCDNAYYGQCTNGSLNSYCGDDTGCQSAFFCDTYINYTYQCTPRPCTSNSQCVADGLGNYCGVNGAGVSMCTNGAIGVSCNSDTQCDSPNVCSPTNRCVAIEGDACTTGTGCLSGFCNSLNGTCSAGTPGSVCGSNSDCNTYTCSSNICSADTPPITANLLAYWPFNETSGTTAGDLSGNSHNGTLDGGVLVNQTGKLGKAYSFDGSTGIVDVGDFDQYVLGKGSLTFSAWIKGDSFDSNRAIFSNTMDNAAQMEFYINPAQLSFCDYTDSEPNGWCAGVLDHSMSLNSWHFVVGVFRSDSIEVYIDGVSIGSGVKAGLTTRQAGADPVNLTIGGRSVDTYIQRWSGLIDEVAIWDRPISPVEITTLYNGGAGMSIITP
jgi:hypothetical protein